MALTVLAAFRSIRDTTQWPVPSTTFNAITSSFGPRIKLSTSAYDWHRGIDINAPEGAPVVAPIDGVLEAVTSFVDGGDTVILRHPFPSPPVFKGKLLADYFTFYMHLSEITASLSEADESGEKPDVPAGFRVGRVGHTGESVVDDHLHFEVRVGTRFSLEFQLENPSSPGAEFGFDPHMHPMLLFPPLPLDMNLTLGDAPSSQSDGIACFESDDDQPLLNRIEFRTIRKKSGKTVASHILDFNRRTGFDASTNVKLDQVDVAKPYISPILFGQSSRFRTDIVVPAIFVEDHSGSPFRHQLVVKDLWNEMIAAAW
jgi:hypothetical protein